MGILDFHRVPEKALPAHLAEDALSATYGTVIRPLSKGAVGDGVANDYAALAQTLTAAATFGSVIDLDGKTYKVGSVLSINKAVHIRNGSIISAVDRVAIVTAANVVLERVQFIRTGPRTASESALTLNAAGTNLINVTATSTVGEGLRMGNGNCNGTTVSGGYYASSDDHENSYGIHLVSGPAHNYDVKISGATIRHSGYGTGIGLYNCSRCTVENCDVRGIRRSPWFTVTGWTLVSGTVYKALDRTDLESNAVYVNDVEYRKNADPASTTPDLNFYTVVGGYIHINTGVNPATQTVKTTRTNGYGILFYATSSEALGMKDNLMSHNYVEDTDGFGLYYQTLQNVPRNNRTLQNTLRNVCKLGITVNDLPFAGIGVFGGLDVQLMGDHIDGVGSVGTPAPGIDFKASIGTPHMTGRLIAVSVLNATSHGISLAPGTWQLGQVETIGNTGDGITHGTTVAGDILQATLDGCVSSSNGINGVHFETTTTAELRLKVIAGRYESNAVRNIACGRARDVWIGGGLDSGAAGTAGINITNTCQRVTLSGIFLRSGVGITVGATIADLTITNVQHDGSSGTKLNANGQWYKTGGNTGHGTQWQGGTGSPEGVVTAVVGSTAMRSDGGAGTTSYVKESGTGNTGWVAK